MLKIILSILVLSVVNVNASDYTVQSLINDFKKHRNSTGVPAFSGDILGAGYGKGGWQNFKVLHFEESGECIRNSRVCGIESGMILYYYSRGEKVRLMEHNILDPIVSAALLRGYANAVELKRIEPELREKELQRKYNDFLEATKKIP